MKHLSLLLTATTLAFTTPAYAEQNKDVQATVAPQSQGDVHVSVNGLVCDFCARALEKVFGKEDAVNNIDVNLDTKIITVTFNEGRSLNDEQITDLITNAGYNVESIHHVK